MRDLIRAGPAAGPAAVEAQGAGAVRAATVLALLAPPAVLLLHGVITEVLNQRGTLNKNRNQLL